ncbi:polymer-forming cytoskeletal protein [Parasphingorhabdus sp. JC815]|uniref:bactofilin family protein n=1 Tax=Parasphingorhabdus sp. JC815 TaxID=3232140 RepID=UPI003457C8AB
MARNNATNGSSFSVIGDGIVITGNIDATVDLHLDGEVIGDIKCLSLVQGPSSKIQGAIVADRASLSGSVEGSIEAGDLVISSSARIGGDVSYENVTIEQGAHVDGSFKHKSSRSAKPAQTQAKAQTQAQAKPAADMTKDSLSLELSPDGRAA